MFATHQLLTVGSDGTSGHREWLRSEHEAGRHIRDTWYCGAYAIRDLGATRGMNWADMPLTYVMGPFKQDHSRNDTRNVR